VSRVRDVDVREYLASAHSGDHRGATRLVLDLVDDGVPADAVIEGLLVTAQRETGFRWHRDEWTIADEHVVTSTTAAVIEALTTTIDHRHDGRHLVVVCAEGDWHALPARLFAERMRIRGWGVSFLGGSTPADDVASFLARRRPDALDRHVQPLRPLRRRGAAGGRGPRAGRPRPHRRDGAGREPAARPGARRR
jgi:methanogenic corrinoid protein MtbC1